jgi:hypothetical protein
VDFVCQKGERGGGGYCVACPFHLSQGEERDRWEGSRGEIDQGFHEGLVEGPIRRTRGGSEWKPIKILLEVDGDSSKTNTASKTRLRLTTQVGQAHVATGVPLDL